MRLGVNIDHVATLRNARGGVQPEPLQAALSAIKGGADQITVHLREDRRHIRDEDVIVLRDTLNVDLNLEMAAVDEMVSIALNICPQQVTLVPEKRQERTTEGGLDLISHKKAIKSVIQKLQDKKICVSLFVEPDKEVIRLTQDLGADGIEIHTGSYANASQSDQKRHIKLIQQAAEYADDLRLLVHAGHGLDYQNVRSIAQMKTIRELNIGHAIISQALFVGLEKAVRDMKVLINGDVMVEGK